MSSDLDMLTVLSDVPKFKRYYHHVRGNFLTSEGEAIAKGMHDYIDDTSPPAIDWNHFAAWYFVKNSMMNFEKKENYKKIFDALSGKPKVDENFTRKILKELTVKSFSDAIAKKAGGISDGSDGGDLSDVETLVKEAQDALMDLAPGDDPTLAPKNFDFLTDAVAGGKPIKFSLDGLRKACAGMEGGDLIVVGAHPNTGKTTFLLGEVAYALPQLEGKDILYFNNEQKMRSMQFRMACAVCGVDGATMKADPAKYWKDYQAKGGERIHLFDKGYMSTKYVAERIKRYEGNIGLIVFDQLWKIRGASKSQNDFMQLAHTFSWARDVAKENNAPIIAVHQADGNTMGTEKYLTMDHLFGSRVAIQGEADLIVTIGRMTDGSTRPDLRHFHVPKNKLEPGTDPLDREPKFDAFIDHDLVKYRDIK